MSHQSHWLASHKHWSHPLWQDWLRSGAIPDLGVDGELCPNKRGSCREDIEAGYPKSAHTSNDEVLFNYVMGQNVAAFSDIISEFTRGLYGRARTVAIFKVLTTAWHSFVDGALDFGTRPWLRRVCEEAR